MEVSIGNNPKMTYTKFDALDINGLGLLVENNVNRNTRIGQALDGVGDGYDIAKVVPSLLTSTAYVEGYVNVTDPTILVGQTIFHIGDGADYLKVSIYNSLVYMECMIGSVMQWKATSNATTISTGWIKYKYHHNGVEPLLELDDVNISLGYFITTDKTIWLQDLGAITTGWMGRRNSASLWLDGALQNFSFYSNVGTLVANYPFNDNSSGNQQNSVGDIVAHLDGVADTFNISTITPSIATATGLWKGYVKPNSVGSPTNQMIVGVRGTSSTHFTRLIDIGGKLYADNYVSSVFQWSVITDAVHFVNGITTEVEINHNGIIPELKINGVAVSQTITSGADDSSWLTSYVPTIAYIGSANGTTWLYNGAVSKFKFYSDNVGTLVADFPLANLNDVSGNDFIMTTLGAPIFERPYSAIPIGTPAQTLGAVSTASRSGSFGVQFNGVDNGFNLDSLVADLQTDNGLIEGWMEFNDYAIGTTQGICHFNNAGNTDFMRVYFTGAGILIWEIRIGGVIQWEKKLSTNIFTNGERYHLALRYNNGVAEIFVDAVQPPQSYNTTLDKFKYLNDMSTLTEGTFGEGRAVYWIDGIFSEWGWYSAYNSITPYDAFNGSDGKQFYDRTVAQKVGLQGFYPCNSVSDISGNENHAVEVGTPTYEATGIVRLPEKVYSTVDQSPNAFEFIQPDLLKMPLAFRNTVRADGADDFLEVITPQALNDSSGIFFFCGRYDGNANMLFNSDDTASGLWEFTFYIQTGLFRIVNYNNGVFEGNSAVGHTLIAGEWFYGWYSSDGLGNWSTNMNGTDTTLAGSGDWLADILLRDNMQFFTRALATSSGASGCIAYSSNHLINKAPMMNFMSNPANFENNN